VTKKATRIVLFLQTVLLILSLQFRGYASAEVVSLTPTDDAYVSSLYPYVNRGSDTKLILACYQDFSGGYALDVNIRVYVKFDLSNIPFDAEVVSAKLELYAIRVEMPKEISAWPCPDSWNEREITYSKAPKYTGRYPGGAIRTYVNAADAWYSWDITSDVTNARGGHLSEVLEMNALIWTERSPNHISFYSKEASDSLYRPRLTVNYSKPIAGSFIACHVGARTIQLGEKLEITGAIAPAHSGALVTITYKSADGSTFTRTVLTSSDGTFSYSFTPQSSGEWSVYASWSGDEDHQGSTGETTSFVVEEKPQITPVPPPGIMGLPIFWILVPIIALSIFAVTALYLTRSRRGAPPFARRRVKPMPPSPPQVPKTPPAMPEVPPAPKEKKLPEVKITFAESLVPLDDKVYLYIVDHGGEISWSQAARDLGVSTEELRASIERLKQARRIE